MKYFLRYYEYSDQLYFKHTVNIKTMYCIYIKLLLLISHTVMVLNIDF